MNFSPLKLSGKAAALAIAITASWTAHAASPSGEQAEPAKYPQFASILSQSKLQISVPNGKPGSKGERAMDSNFSGIVDENFYVDKASEAFVFKMEGYKLRNELRVLENFKSDEANTFHRLSANLQLVNPYDSIKNSNKTNEITILQVHNKGTVDDGNHGVGYIPHPLLRVVWLGERKGIKNHFWAVVKNNALNCSKKTGDPSNPECKKSYVKYDLGAAKADAPTQFDIIVGNKSLEIKLDGQTKVEHDLSYWAHLLSYFKAGVYNQFKNGQSEAHFYQLDVVTETK